MRRLLILCTLACMALCAHGQFVMPVDSGLTMPRSMRLGIRKTYVGGQVMNNRAYEGYLRNTSPAAYNQFRRGRNMTIAGWTGVGVGGGMLVAGLPLLLSGVAYYKPVIAVGLGIPAPTFVQSIAYIRSAVGLGIGGVLLGCGGGALLSIGYGNMNKAVNIYNAEATRNCPTYWTISTGATAQGDLGFNIAYNF